MNYFQSIKSIALLVAIAVVATLAHGVTATTYVPATAGQQNPLPFLDVSGSAQSKQGWLALGAASPNPLAVLDVTGTVITDALAVIGNTWASGKIRIGGTSIPGGTDPQLVVDNLRVRSSSLAGSGDRQVCADSNGLFKICATTPMSGVCGSANGSVTSVVPTTNLCSSGTASVVSGTGPWTWTCSGSNGGSAVACSANVLNVMPGTLYVKKIVATGTKLPGQFTIHVYNSNNVDVSGSPQPGNATNPGTQYSLSPGNYIVQETYDPGYTVSYSADCPGGNVTVVSGQTKTCTLTNTLSSSGSVTYLRNTNGGNQYISGSSCVGCTNERFTVPAGVTSISVGVVGGGAGGGAAGFTGLMDGSITTSQVSGGGAGGGGGYTGVQNMMVTPGQTYLVYVGKRGAAGIIGSAPGCTPGSQSGNTGFSPDFYFYFSGYCDNDARIGDVGQPSFIVGPVGGSTPDPNINDWIVDIVSWINLVFDPTKKTIMAGGAFGGFGTSNLTPGLGGLGGLNGPTAPNGSANDISIGLLATGVSYTNVPTGTVTRTAGENGGNGHLFAACQNTTVTLGGDSGISVPSYIYGDGGNSGYFTLHSNVPNVGCDYTVEAPDVGKHGAVTISW